MKEWELNFTSIEPGRGGFKDIDDKSDQQVDTPEMLGRSMKEVVSRDGTLLYHQIVINTHIYVTQHNIFTYIKNLL